jgi:hypothetical protein
MPEQTTEAVNLARLLEFTSTLGLLGTLGCQRRNTWDRKRSVSARNRGSGHVETSSRLGDDRIRSDLTR